MIMSKSAGLLPHLLTAKGGRLAKTERAILEASLVYKDIIITRTDGLQTSGRERLPWVESSTIFKSCSYISTVPCGCILMSTGIHSFGYGLPK